MLKLYFLVLSFPVIAFAANCPICPSGGIWSEWTTKEKCATTCGSCSKLNYSRTCLSSEMKNCPCSGSTKSTQFCGTQACNYPRANGNVPPCCNGLVPTIINNWYYCANASEPTPTTPCCPTGGIWGEWTNWMVTSGKAEWTRTRKCLSGGFNCACVGELEQVKNDCPCAPMKTISSTANPCASLTDKVVFDYRQPVFFASSCTTRIALESSNYRGNFYFDTGSARPSCTTGYVDETGKCKLAEFFTGDMHTHGQFWIFTFICNTTTGGWDRYYKEADLDMRGVTQIGQFYTVKTKE